MSKNLLRIFIAIDMPKAVKLEIAQIQKNLKDLDLIDGTYVNPEHAHLTLQFIGYIEPSALSPIKKILKNIAFEPFEVHLGQVGAFGNHNFIRIIWLDLVGKQISDLAHEIEKALSLGTVSLRRPFQAHLTLVRVKSITDVEALRRVLCQIKVEPISFTVENFVLKQSALTREGPIYVDLETYPE